ncbi:MAG: AI-2E family transporter [Lachnospiraceae bacterium]
MKSDNKNLKKAYLLILFIALMILGIINFDKILGLLSGGFQVIFPLLLGGIMAFIMNLPMRKIETVLFQHDASKWKRKIKRPMSIVLSLLFMLSIIALIIFMVVPQLISTVIDLGMKIPKFVEDSLIMLEKICADNPEIVKFIEGIEIKDIAIDWKSFMNNALAFVTSGFGNAMNMTVSIAGSFIHTLVSIGIALVFSIYLLSQKEKLGRQVTMVMQAFLPTKIANTTMKCLRLLNKNFSNFIAGQCVEAIILGCMFTISMTVFRFPYALLVGVLIAFTALIPIFGAFIGCGVGAFLILIESPMQALLFIILFLVLQQVEGNFIYPHVVGSSVGLPSIWIFVSVTLGGSLFGIVGILTFIPLMSTAYELLKEAVHKRQDMNISNNTSIKTLLDK